MVTDYRRLKGGKAVTGRVHQRDKLRSPSSATDEDTGPGNTRTLASGVGYTILLALQIKPIAM